jgi:hypothetical protein
LLLPQGHGSFLPTFGCRGRILSWNASLRQELEEFCLCLGSIWSAHPRSVGGKDRPLKPWLVQRLRSVEVVVVGGAAIQTEAGFDAQLLRRAVSALSGPSAKELLISEG